MEQKQQQERILREQIALQQIKVQNLEMKYYRLGKTINMEKEILRDIQCGLC